MKIYYDIVQKSDAWFALREKKLTGSNATAIAANGAGLVTYVHDIVLDLITPERKDIGHLPDIKRGNDLEQFARIKYEMQTGRIVTEVGFVEYNENCGISPDGLVFFKKTKQIIGGTEFKAKNDKNHLAFMLHGKTESSDKNQCQMNMFVTGAAWWDLCSYYPNFKNSLVIQRQLPNAAYFTKLETGIPSGILQLKDLLKTKEIQHELTL